MRPDDTACINLLSFVPGHSYSDLTTDLQFRFAVERGIEIIGEAAGRVSPEFRERHPEVPWREIVAQRNVIAHQYSEILYERIWRLLTENLNRLLSNLEAILADEGDQGNPAP
jgi:uncharacterized protein with HEPN domain